jgi:hypothetical protein
MKNPTSKNLGQAFRAWRKKNSFGAVAVLSATALQSLSPDAGAAQLARSIVAEHSTDDGIGDEEISGTVSRFADRDEVAAHGGFAGGYGYTLTRAERASLPHREKVAAPVTGDDSEDLLPADFIPAPVTEFVPAIDPALDAEIAEQARREAQEEIAKFESDLASFLAATGFDSQPFTGIPVDYAPRVPTLAELFPKTREDKPAPVSDFEALRRAVLAL